MRYRDGWELMKQVKMVEINMGSTPGLAFPKLPDPVPSVEVDPHVVTAKPLAVDFDGKDLSTPSKSETVPLHRSGLPPKKANPKPSNWTARILIFLTVAIGIFVYFRLLA